MEATANSVIDQARASYYQARQFFMDVVGLPDATPEAAQRNAEIRSQLAQDDLAQRLADALSNTVNHEKDLP